MAGNFLQLLSNKVSKENLQLSAETLVENILEIHDALTGFVAIHALGTSIDTAKKMLKERAVNKFYQSGWEKEAEILGAKVTLRNTPKQWDYHNDNELVKMNMEIVQHEAKIESLKADIKARKGYLERLKEPVYGLGGEVLGEPATLISDLTNGQTLVVSYDKN